MMDDKEFNLLEKIYVELQETKKELKADIQSNSNHIIRLENEFHDKFGALIDELKVISGGVTVLKDDVAYIKERVDTIEEKVKDIT